MTSKCTTGRAMFLLPTLSGPMTSAPSKTHRGHVAGTINRQHKIPASKYPSAIQKPHSSSQMMLSSVRTPSILPASALLRRERADDLGGQAFGDAQPRSVVPGAFGDLPWCQPHTV